MINSADTRVLDCTAAPAVEANAPRSAEGLAPVRSRIPLSDGPQSPRAGREHSMIATGTGAPYLSSITCEIRDSDVLQALRGPSGDRVISWRERLSDQIQSVSPESTRTSGRSILFTRSADAEPSAEGFWVTWLIHMGPSGITAAQVSHQLALHQPRSQATRRYYRDVLILWPLPPDHGI